MNSRSAHIATSHHIGSGRQLRRNRFGTIQRMMGAPATDPSPALRASRAYEQARPFPPLPREVRVG